MRGYISARFVETAKKSSPFSGELSLLRDMRRGAWARHTSRRALEEAPEPACEMAAQDAEPLRAVLALLILSPQRVFTCEMLLCAISLLTESAFGDRI